MPWLLAEKRTGRQIAGEFEKLARFLHGWPEGSSTSERGVVPSRAILKSLKTINATFAKGVKKGTVDRAGFRVIGREFQHIGKTVSKLGGSAKKS